MRPEGVINGMSELRTVLQRTAHVQNGRPGFRAWFFSVLLVMLSFLVILPFLSVLHRIPEAGSGLSLFIGSQILEGKVPYRDFWDFRPPLIFFLNALGLALSRLRLEYWVLEWAAIAASGLMLFRFLKRYFGMLPAWLASAGMITGLTAIQNYGNLPEEFALPLQALVLLLLVQSVDRSGGSWHLFAIGIVTGLASSLRLTLFGTGLVVSAYLLITRLHRRDWRGLLRLAWIGAGFGLVWVVWIAYFAAEHSLPEFFDQVFRYQLYYLRVSNPQRLSALSLSLDALLHGTAFVVLGFLAWLAVVPFLLFHEDNFRRFITGRVWGVIVVLLGLGLTFNSLYDDISHRIFDFSAMSIYRIVLLASGLLLLGFAGLILTGHFRRILDNALRHFQPADSTGLFLPLSIALVDLPIQLVLASLPGIADPALFLPVFPSVAILVSFLLWSFLPSTNNKVGENAQSDGSVQKDAWMLFTILTFVIVITSLVTVGKAVPAPYNDTEEIADLQAYLQSNARPGDTILLWSRDSQVYRYISQSPASRYLDQRALFSKGYTTADMVNGFLKDIRAIRPQFIVYSSTWNEPLLHPGDREQCSQLETEEFVISMQEKDRFRWTDTLVDRPFVPVEMRPVYRWICENYEKSAELGGTRSTEPWILYRLNQPVP
jgi:hypothetical protein